MCDDAKPVTIAVIGRVASTILNSTKGRNPQCWHSRVFSQLSVKASPLLPRRTRVRNYGAISDGRTLATVAINPAIQRSALPCTLANEVTMAQRSSRRCKLSNVSSERPYH
jgi:hypothetical protein